MQAPLAAPTRSLDLRPRPHAPAVLLVDDHDLFRTGLRQLLESAGIRIVGDCRCNDAAIEMARRTSATVAVLDAHAVDGAPTDMLVERMCQTPDAPGIVVHARGASRTDLYRAVRAGARAYVSKDEPAQQLAHAVRIVHDGGAWLAPPLLAVALELLRTGEVPMTSPSDMSDRELEVLRLLARGLDNNEVALELGISAKTAKNHVSSILTKLQVTNRVQAAVWAVRAGYA